MKIKISLRLEIFLTVGTDVVGLGQSWEFFLFCLYLKGKFEITRQSFRKLFSIFFFFLKPIAQLYSIGKKSLYK